MTLASVTQADVPRVSPHRLIDVLTDSRQATHAPHYADQVRFRSPFTDYHGQETVLALVELICRVLGEVRTEIQLSNGATTMSTFAGTVGDEPVQGVVVEQQDATGRIVDVMLTVRPYRGLRSAMAAMGDLMTENPLLDQHPER